MKKQEHAKNRSNAPSDRLDKRLERYLKTFSNRAKDSVGLTAAAGAFCAMTPAAEAAIQYSGPLTFNTAFFAFNGACGGSCFTRTQIPITDSGGSTLANFYLSAYAGFSLYVNLNFGTGGTINDVYTPGALGEAVAFSNDPADFVDRPALLGSGDTIGPATDFFSPAIANPNNNKRLTGKGRFTTPIGNWEQGDIGYVGLKFDTAGGNASHYGWVRLEVVFDGNPTPNQLGSGFWEGAYFGIVNAVDWAFETTPDTPILAGDTGSTVAPIQGDFDGDGDVDGVDLGVFAFDFANSPQGGPPYAQSDFDEDGDVDGVDLGVFSFNFANFPPTSTAVPEPSSAVALGIGLLAMGSRGLRLHRGARRRQEKAATSS